MVAQLLSNQQMYQPVKDIGKVRASKGKLKWPLLT